MTLLDYKGFCRKNLQSFVRLQCVLPDRDEYALYVYKSLKLTVCMNV